jgi:hypothetical protein
MKVKNHLSVLVIILIGLMFTSRAKGEQFPFGIIYSQTPDPDNVTAASLDSLKTILGFNSVYLTRTPYGFTRQTLRFFKTNGMDITSYMMDSTDQYSYQAFDDYLNAHYLKMEAEDNVSATRFLTKNGEPDGNGWFCHGTSASPFALLDDFAFSHECYYMNEDIRYRPIIRIWADSGNGGIGFDTTDVAILNIWEKVGTDNHGSRIYADTIRGSDFDFANPVEDSLNVFNYRASCEGKVFTYQVVSSGACSLAVDWLEEFNDQGKRVVAESYWDSTYARYCTQSWVQDTIAMWMLRDDIKYDMLIPAKHVDSIIAEQSGKPALSKWAPSYIPSIPEYVHLAQPRVIGIDPYPFKGGSWDGTGACSGGWGTLYAGNYWAEGAHWVGLQNVLNNLCANRLADLRKTISDSSRQADLYYWAQMQSRCYYDCCLYDSSYIERPPTASEMRCEAGIALCYGIKGLFYWPYGYHYGISGHQVTTIGLIEKPGGVEQPSEAWQELSEYVTPWVKALSPYFADPDLIWQRAYRFSPSGPYPSSNFISSIQAISNSPDSNPDLGWFQVGEFTKAGTNDKYLMLVNRACSQGEWDPTEAPSITATVRFNPSTIGSDYVLITDLADSLRHAGGDTGWVGIPKTTYSAKMPDGTIPYTIALRAGEGKLLKIVATNSIQLSGAINTDYIYQGRISVIGDATVDTAKTMLIKGPARLELYRCDLLQGGGDPNRVELIVKGHLDATGTPENPVIFFPDTINTCGGGITRVHPQMDDWYGIYLR